MNLRNIDIFKDNSVFQLEKYFIYQQDVCFFILYDFHGIEAATSMGTLDTCWQGIIGQEKVPHKNTHSTCNAAFSRLKLTWLWVSLVCNSGRPWLFNDSIISGSLLIFGGERGIKHSVVSVMWQLCHVRRGFNCQSINPFSIVFFPHYCIIMIDFLGHSSLASVPKHECHSLSVVCKYDQITC